MIAQEKFKPTNILHNIAINLYGGGGRGGGGGGGGPNKRKIIIILGAVSFFLMFRHYVHRLC
jgi:hypothetical protein